MPVKSINFTKPTLEKLSHKGEPKRTWYRDTQISDLAIVCLPSGLKSFYVVKKIDGRTEKIYLGKFPDLSVENARKLAMGKLGQIALGVNPLDKKRKEKQEMTLGHLFEQYMKRYSKLHKKSWKYDEREIPRHLGHWFNRKIDDIKRSEILKQHEIIFAEIGRYQANRILERIRALYNKAIEWGWEGKNPTAGIKKFTEKSRDRFVQPAEMPYLIRAIEQEHNETIRDFIWMLLLTGARKTNTLMMRWNEINWETQQWRIPDTKNGDPAYVPLTERSLRILRRRMDDTTSDWVFPQIDDPTKHFIKHDRGWMRTKERATVFMWQDHPKVASWTNETLKSYTSFYNSISQYRWLLKQAEQEKIILPPGVMDIRLHDLRRTFGSYQAITGASLQIIGKSLGHKSTHATQIYARLNLDAVRSSVEKATETMFNL
jgi:integrase